MLEQRVKKTLEDIIDIAFADIPEEKRERYKWFKLRLVPKELKRRNGQYNLRTHIIEVNNASRGVSQLAKTCLHEVSHHIDWCNRRECGHGKPFYEIYAKLIYAALDMKIMKAEDMIDVHSADCEKVNKIVAQYTPRKIEYTKENKSIIKVMNGYSIKEDLKEHGYHWNNMEQVWELAVEEDEEEAEEGFLVEIGVADTNKNDGKPWYSIEDNSLYIDAYVLIEAKGDTYKNREALKACGLTYNTGKKSAWTLKVKASELEEKKNALIKYCYENNVQDIEFAVVGRKVKKQKAKTNIAAGEKS